MPDTAKLFWSGRSQAVRLPMTIHDTHGLHITKLAIRLVISFALASEQRFGLANA